MRKTKSHISRELRLAVYARDGKRCRYCGSMEGPFALDHIYPESKGGITCYENLVVSCKFCNSHKHAKIGIWPKTDRPVTLSYPNWAIFLLASGMILYHVAAIAGLIFHKFSPVIYWIGIAICVIAFVFLWLINSIRQKVGGIWRDFYDQ